MANTEQSIKKENTHKKILDFWSEIKPTGTKRQYIKDHAQRFATTIDIIKKHRANITSALDIAGNDVSRHLFSHFLEIENYKQTPKDFNIEKDSWEGQFKENSFDLVILTEVIEHMAADPAKVIHWSNRLLKDGGLLIVSTPNICRSHGLYNLIHGRSPYHWGVLFGKKQDRHQREYAPWELAELVAVHDFQVELSTSDVYEKFEAHKIADQWLEENFKHQNPSLKGDSIFICATKYAESQEITRIDPIYDSSIAASRDEKLIGKMSKIEIKSSWAINEK